MTNDTLTEMWTALERLQPIADRNDIALGLAWRQMTVERTREATKAASRLCSSAARRAQEDGAALEFMSSAAWFAADALLPRAAWTVESATKALQAVRS